LAEQSSFIYNIGNPEIIPYHHENSERMVGDIESGLVLSLPFAHLADNSQNFAPLGDNYFSRNS
jgi:hypothetical protein